MSQLFPQLDRRLVRRLLRTGMHVPVEQSALSETAAAMARLGLIAVTPRSYLKCVNAADEDYWHVIDRHCPGEIELEGDGPHDCPECGRTIDYPAVQKRVFQDQYVAVRAAGAAKYLFTALHSLDIVRKLETSNHSAARVSLSGGGCLILPIVDYAGAGWQAPGRDAQRVHAYVIASPVNRPPREYLERAYHFELADVLANDQGWLARVIDTAARPRRTAFISYSPTDAPFVDRLAEDLVAHGVGVWLDRWEIRVGESITDRIQEGLLESDYLLLVLSPSSVNSPWVREELNAARMAQLESRRVVILPVVYQKVAMPPLLKDKRYADCRGKRYDRGVEDLLQVLAPSAAIGRSAPVHWGPRRAEVPDVRAEVREGAAARKGLHRKLLTFIRDSFDAEDLQTLCFDLDVVYDDLPAKGRKSKARELIAYLEKRGRVQDLIDLLREERPKRFTESGLEL